MSEIAYFGKFGDKENKSKLIMWKWRGSWMWRERTCRLLAVTETPTGQLNCNVCPGVAFIMML